MLSVDGTTFAARSNRPVSGAPAATDAERAVLRAHIRSVLTRVLARRNPASAQAN